MCVDNASSYIDRHIMNNTRYCPEYSVSVQHISCITRSNSSMTYDGVILCRLMKLKLGGDRKVYYPTGRLLIYSELQE